MAYAQILIIDENERARARLAKQLTDLAYDVHTVATQKDALARLKAAAANGEPYECICLGPMEHTSGLGYEVFRTIRRLGGAYRDILIIGASYEESFWNPVRNKPYFLTAEYGFIAGTNEPKWDVQSLRDNLPTPKAMAVI